MRRLFLVVAAVIVASGGLEAKGPTVKLTLSGPGLAHAVEITDPGVLQQSNVWDGGFIGDTSPAAPKLRPGVYRLDFDVQLPEWRRAGVKKMYTVSLARDAGPGGLWLYLPGRGDAGYTLNAGTILRDTKDGRWHRPPAAWAAALANYLP